jgi:hypothetical protein
MPSSPIVRLALLLACALLPCAAMGQAGHRSPTNQAPPQQRQAVMASPAARREWDGRRDWTHFTTRILGDTAVTDSMKALLASGLSANTRDKYGRTALHAAVLLGQLELARFLLSKGADVNARDEEGRTPLMVSASAGGFDHFGGLATVSPWGLIWTEPVCDLKRQEEQSPPAVQGFDSWHDMVVVQRPMMRLLVDAGADASLKDPQGRDVLDYAATAGPAGLERLLPAKAVGGGPPRCDLDLARAPEVRGLRLGMTLREATSRFGPSRVSEPEWCGRQALEFDWSNDLLGQPAPRPRELAGVRRIRLGFLDGRLAYFRVTYDPSDTPLTPEQFRSTLSSALALPGRWRSADGSGGRGLPFEVGCEGFVVFAGYEDGPYVELHDTGATDLLLRRREEEKLRRLREAEQEKERRRKVFKP